jgi:hypothetical protein
MLRGSDKNRSCGSNHEKDRGGLQKANRHRSNDLCLPSCCRRDYHPILNFANLAFAVMNVVICRDCGGRDGIVASFFTKQRNSVLAPRCVNITQSDADKLPVSEFCRSFSGVLASRCRASPSPPSAGSFAGSCNPVPSQLIDAQASRVVAGGGIEPPTQGFSVLCSTN